MTFSRKRVNRAGALVPKKKLHRLRLKRPLLQWASQIPGPGALNYRLASYAPNARHRNCQWLTRSHSETLRAGEVLLLSASMLS